MFCGSVWGQNFSYAHGVFVVLIKSLYTVHAIPVSELTFENAIYAIILLT